MPRAAVLPTVTVSVLLLAALILPLFAGENPRTQTEAAKTPEPGFMLTLETVEAPGIDIKPYFTAVAAVLRHSWPSRMQANLITRAIKESCSCARLSCAAVYCNGAHRFSKILRKCPNSMMPRLLLSAP